MLAVDDHPLVREGIAALVAGQPDIDLVAEARDGHEALEKFRQHRPDVVLLDMQMPGLSGIDTIGAIRVEFATARIIVLTTYAGDELAKRALRAGTRRICSRARSARNCSTRSDWFTRDRSGSTSMSPPTWQTIWPRTRFVPAS